MSIDATVVIAQRDAAQEHVLSSVLRAGPFGVRRLRGDASVLTQLDQLAPGLRGRLVLIADFGRLAEDGLWWPTFATALRARLPSAVVLLTDAGQLQPGFRLRQWARKHGAHDLMGAISVQRLHAGLEPIQALLTACGLQVLDVERAQDMLRTLAPAEFRADARVDARGSAAVHAIWRHLEQSGIEPRSLARHMQSRGGVDIADRTYRLKTYPQCFRGDEAVAWLAAQLGVSRAQAVDVGELLRRHGAFEHVALDHGFLDEGKFYRFTAEHPELDAIELDLVAKECRNGGFDVRDRLWRAQAYPAVFLGSEAHAWLMRFYGLSAAGAQALGQQLLDTHLFRHVVDEHGFAAKPLFYRFTSDRHHANPIPTPSAEPAFSRSVAP
ncbi:hypothetical protein [Silanimonas sp.]|uniref:hypothetical protein n=1 Tax=Silanimonas sp. TaxID=1929290 RepID=UPI0022C905F8|nr:hypothetical protein [Silanimonas sp.]MCZ8165659.1 hypothetical protein [Silanimonas sp.]